MEDILKQLYGEAVTEERLAKFREELGKKFVPKADFNQRGEELKMLREKLGELETVAADKEAFERERESLSQELSSLKEQYATDMAAARKKEEEILLKHAIDDALTEAKARSLPAVRALLNLEEITFEDGVLTGLSKQIEILKKEHGYLFEPGVGNLQFIRPTGLDAALSLEDFQKLGYMERLKLKKEQPALYQTLTQQTGGKQLWQRI